MNNTYTHEQLTSWFQNCKPSRIGVYQVKLNVVNLYDGSMSFVVHYAYFNGSDFGQIRTTPEETLSFPTSKVRRPIVWRGLKENI
jgi:hypothetical protein